MTGLDCVGWLTNMRARDLPCTPLAVAYALVTMDSCTLFIAPGRLNDADAKRWPITAFPCAIIRS